MRFSRTAAFSRARGIYADPFSGKAQWGLVAAPQGGIAGVYSLSAGRQAGEYLYTPPY